MRNTSFSNSSRSKIGINLSHNEDTSCAELDLELYVIALLVPFVSDESKLPRKWDIHMQRNEREKEREEEKEGCWLWATISVPLLKMDEEDIKNLLRQWKQQSD